MSNYSSIVNTLTKGQKIALTRIAGQESDRLLQIQTVDSTPFGKSRGERLASAYRNRTYTAMLQFIPKTRLASIGINVAR